MFNIRFLNPFSYLLVSTRIDLVHHYKQYIYKWNTCKQRNIFLRRGWLDKNILKTLHHVLFCHHKKIFPHQSNVKHCGIIHNIPYKDFLMLAFALWPLPFWWNGCWCNTIWDFFGGGDTVYKFRWWWMVLLLSCEDEDIWLRKKVERLLLYIYFERTKINWSSLSHQHASRESHVEFQLTPILLY